MPSSSVLGRVLDRVTRPPILTAFAALLGGMVAVVAAAYLATITAPQPDHEAHTGDFPAFFTGALVLREGHGRDLYDLPTQRAIQAEYLGGAQARWQPYLNPPALALALAPTTDLGYAASYRIFAGTLFTLLVVGLLFLARATTGVGSGRVSRTTAILLVLGFLPVALTTFGGQNTALTLALLSSLYAAHRLQRPVLAGLLLGALTFKPQYVPVLGLVFLLQRNVTVVLVAAAVGLAHYALGAMVCGFDWPVNYLSVLAEHGPREVAENGPWHFSLPAVARRLLPPPLATVATYAGALGIVLAMVAAGRRVGRDAAAHPAFFGVAVTGTMLLSPHLQYYEAGILSLPAWLAVETVLRQGQVPPVWLRVLLAVGYLGYPLWSVSESVGIQPLFFLLVGMFLWTVHLTRLPVPAPR